MMVKVRRISSSFFLALVAFHFRWAFASAAAADSNNNNKSDADASSDQHFHPLFHHQHRFKPQQNGTDGGENARAFPLDVHLSPPHLTVVFGETTSFELLLERFFFV
jgi:hypothetical protein